MELTDLVVNDPEVMSSTLCFRGTRVPVSVRFENLAASMSVDAILATWPTLRRDGLLAVLELAGEEVGRWAAKPALAAHGTASRNSAETKISC